MVHGLFFGEFGDGRQHPESIGGQEDDVLGMACHAGQLGVGDVVQGISHPGVFRNAVVGEIRHPVLGIHHHVFHYRTEPDSPVDFRLAVFRQVDALGIAAPFDVEHPVVSPAVFVIPDQGTLRIGGQGGLAGTGQAEEQGHISFVPFVAGTVHSQDALTGQQVVHHGENGFLQFPGVHATADQDHFLVEVQDDEGFRMGMVRGRIRFHAGQGDYREIFLDGAGFIGLDEQLADENGLPGHFVDEFHPDLVFGICPSLHVLHIDLVGLDEFFAFGIEPVESFLAAGLVVVPVHHIMGQRGVHNEFVLGRTARMGPGGYPQRTPVGKGPFSVTDGFFNQFTNAQISYSFFRFR